MQWPEIRSSMGGIYDKPPPEEDKNQKSREEYWKKMKILSIAFGGMVAFCGGAAAYALGVLF